MSTKREKRPAPGTFYRHFKNKLYQILAVAIHSETGEEMVVYQALYGDYKIYVRPLSMFMSPVDREKYPDVSQEYRFEQVEPGGELSGTEMEYGLEYKTEDGTEYKTERKPEHGTEESPMDSHWVEAFLDAETAEKQLAVLRKCSGKICQRDLDCICLALDMPSDSKDKSIEEQLENIRNAIRLKLRYDGGRLRS